MGKQTIGHKSEIHKQSELQLVLPPRLRVSSYALTREPYKASQAPLRASPPPNYRLASVFLTPRHWQILRLTFAHPLLSRENVSQFLLLSRKTTNQLLVDLKRADYLTEGETLNGERWLVAEAGLRLLARLVRFPLEGNPLIQRGVIGLQHQIRHTAGVYAFFWIALRSVCRTKRTNGLVGNGGNR